MFKMFLASLQTFIDTPNCVLEDRVQYSSVHIPNVFYDGDIQIINYVGDCNRQVHGDFLITLYNRDERCLLCGKNWVYKSSSLRFFFKGLNLSYVA